MDEREALDELSGTDDPADWARGFATMVADKGDDMSLDDVVNWFDEAMTTAKSFQWRDDARELLGVQEMLAHVLIAVGKPVVVTVEQRKSLDLSKYAITLEDDEKTEAYIFDVREVSDDE